MRSHKKITVILLTLIVCVNCFSHSFFLFENFANIATKSVIVKNISMDDSAKNENSNIKIGDYVRFGKYYDIVEDDEVKKVPIVWRVLDIEDGSLRGLGRNTLNEIVTTFGEIIENAGYYFGVYSNLDWYNNVISGSELNKKYD